MARETWTMIGREFNKLRDQGKTIAYQTKQKRIHEYFGILTEIMSPKDLLEEARKCEDFMTERGGSATNSPLDELADFLNGKPSTERVQ